MHNLPKSQGTAVENHEVAVKALQAWIWACVAQGWDITKPNDTRWTHEDNMAAAQLGWMIANPPHSPYLDLFCITRDGMKPHEMMKRIIRSAPIDPLCAKAVMVLSALRLQHPDVKFAFSQQSGEPNDPA